MARWQTCNVLESANDLRRLFQFGLGHQKPKLQREESRLPNQPLPEKLFAKDWQTLAKPRLNVAWLPAHQVFLRALQLPTADFAETQSMVELQLEKLSPLPIAQVVWSFEVWPSGGLAPVGQTVVVIIVARHLVEEFLGKLETQGYLADRLELPFLDQLQATQVRDNGVWIYPDVSGEGNSCLVAWWYDGILQNLSLINLPAQEARATVLQNQLTQMIWAGELEGWMTSPPRFHLVAEGQTAQVWLQYFAPDQDVEIVSPAPPHELAARTAARATNETPRMNLLPPEYAARYRQQFVDRLWMRGLGAVLMVYLAGVAIYFGMIQFANWKLGRVEKEVVGLGPSYTNTMQLKERMKVLQDQVELQFAALDCYKAVADSLPDGLTLDTLTFDGGRKLTLSGTAPNDGVSKVQDFNAQLRKAVTVKNQPLFSKINPPNINPRPGGQEITWIFPTELKRTDTE